MKALILIATLASTSSVLAAAKLVCIGMDGYKNESTLTRLNVNGLINNECDEEFYGGNKLCFQGEAAEAGRILQGLSNADILGNDYILKNIRTSGNSVSYTIWDGANDEEVSRISIPRCR